MNEEYYPMVLMPQAIRDQLEAIAPLANNKTAKGDAAKKDEKPEPERLPVHSMAIMFGMVLCVMGLLSGKTGVLVLGLLVGGSIIAMGLLPTMRLKRNQNKPFVNPVVNENAENPNYIDPYNFAMTDKEWKWEGIRIWLKRHHNPPDIFLPSPIRSRPEQRFAMILHQFFPHNIVTDKVIELFQKGNAYHPDFAFVEADAQLYLDIEIDEPYASRGQQPTHYRQPNGVSPDNSRNAYFLQKGWVVVRFAEQQIVLYPDECCKFVARLVFQLTGNDTYWSQWSYAQPQLPLVRQWTKEEAMQMAKENYRQSYS